jgi:hypothetical protein
VVLLKYFFPEIIKETNKLVELNNYSLPLIVETATFFAIALLAFFVPILFAHSQPLVGPIVNALLITAAINARGWKKIISLITLPSLSALIAGQLFGFLTAALLYMVPFIWFGNAILVFVFKKLFVAEKKNYFLTLGIAATAKATLLFSAAFLLNSVSLVPTLFLTAMGIMQLLTAIAGGIVAFPINFLYSKKFSTRKA